MALLRSLIYIRIRIATNLLESLQVSCWICIKAFANPKKNAHCTHVCRRSYVSVCVPIKWQASRHGVVNLLVMANKYAKFECKFYDHEFMNELYQVISLYEPIKME